MNDGNESELGTEEQLIDVVIRPDASARGFELKPSMKALLASVDAGFSLKALMAEVDSGPSLKALLASVDRGPSMKALLAGVDRSTSLKAMLRGGDPNVSIKALFGDMRSLTDSPAIKAFAGSESSLAPEQWGLSSTTTLEEVFEEFVIRTNASEEATSVALDPIVSDAGFESGLSISDHYFIELLPAERPKPSLRSVPTWVLVVWMWLLCPPLYVIVNWESARVGLADLNARLPQTETLSGVRQFIRKELAGKPGNFRIVTGANVHLRAGPGMKSEVLLRLPKESIVVVLGKENRTWLFVSYEHQGYMIDGYVSTTYLKKVN